MKPSKPSKRRKSNPWDNPLTPEHKAIALVKGMVERCENPVTRKGLKESLAMLRKKRAALRGSA